jgi:hypothetical protein
MKFSLSRSVIIRNGSMIQHQIAYSLEMVGGAALSERVAKQQCCNEEPDFEGEKLMLLSHAHAGTAYRLKLLSAVQMRAARSRIP